LLGVDKLYTYGGCGLSERGFGTDVLNIEIYTCFGSILEIE